MAMYLSSHLLQLHVGAVGGGRNQLRQRTRCLWRNRSKTPASSLIDRSNFEMRFGSVTWASDGQIVEAATIIPVLLL